MNDYFILYFVKMTVPTESQQRASLCSVSEQDDVKQAFTGLSALVINLISLP